MGGRRPFSVRILSAKEMGGFGYGMIETTPSLCNNRVLTDTSYFDVC